jgi:hypothetical protein
VCLPAKLEKDPAGHDVQAEAPVSRQTKMIDQKADRDTDISIKPDVVLEGRSNK